MGACSSSKREKAKPQPQPQENVIERSAIIDLNIQTKENIQKETSIINSIENQNQIIKNNQLEKEELIINNNIKSNDKLKNEHNNNINQNNNYYLICPNCSTRSPHIEKLYYDNDSKNFLVKYTCICSDNTFLPKEINLLNILSNKEPLNNCNIHINNKLINFCKTCNRGICLICKETQHKYHNLDNDIINKPISKEDANKFLEIIKEKEHQFNIEIEKNEKKIENELDFNIHKLNKERMNYKEEIKNYKENNQKTFNFLKNLYERYINNNNNSNNNNNDVMLTNHIHNFAIKNNDISKLNSNVDEIINQFNDKNKELKLEYDYGFSKINEFSIEDNKNKISQNLFNYQKDKVLTCKKTLLGHTEKVVSLIELDSGKIASGSYDDTIRIWDLDSGKQDLIIKESGRVFCLLEFEKNKILTGVSDNSITLWDLDFSTGNYVYNFLGHDLWVNCLVKCDNNYFASASNDTKIKIWDYFNRECLSTLKGHQDCVLALTLLKNKNLCSGSADLTIKIWDWEKKNCISTLKGHEKWVKCVCELNNGIILSGSDDNTIKIWKNYMHIKTLQEHTHSVRTICQINDNYFASGSFDSKIRIWEIDTWKCVQILFGHSMNIICIISLKCKNRNNNNNCIASCSNDRTIKIWEGNINN